MEIFSQIDKSELQIRWQKIQQMMMAEGVEACLISSSSNLLYVSGRIIGGYAYLPQSGEPLFFVRRPVGLQGENVFYIRKPEQMPEMLQERGLMLPEVLMLEGDEMSHADWLRLEAVFLPQKMINSSHPLRVVRSVKTETELAILRQTAKIHSDILSLVPQLYMPGMTDTQLSAEVEKQMRINGCMPLLRIFGPTMQGGMACVWAGDNAAAPSPYDFSLGGSGHLALPMGDNGTILTEGMAAMIDSGMNTGGYISDQTRTFSIGKLPQKAYDVHQVSIEIQDLLMDFCKPGAVCEEAYLKTLQIVEKHGLSDCFMGQAQQAKFVGHGVGIVVNELPVLCDRNKSLLEQNMCIAIEPKFIVPGVGAVGTENTFIVGKKGLEKITSAPEEIINLVD